MAVESEYYFDHAASCPPYPESLKAANDTALAYFANPSARHSEAGRSWMKLDELKKEFCRFLGFPDGRLVLTSGATEANNLIFRHALRTGGYKKIAMAEDVHDSIFGFVDEYEDRVDLLPINDQGQLKIEEIQNLENHSLLCISMVCHENGVCHDVARIGELCRRKKIPLLVDGVQAVGHMPLDLKNIPFDDLTFSAHKFGGPRGVGGVLTRRQNLTPQMLGGDQEDGFRAGTENVPGLAGAVKALERCIDKMDESNQHQKSLCRYFLEELNPVKNEMVINSPEDGLPGLLSISFIGKNGHVLVNELSQKGFCVSTGSACHEQREEAPRIIVAQGRPYDTALGTLRFSFGEANTPKSVRACARQLRVILKRGN